MSTSAARESHLSYVHFRAALVCAFVAALAFGATSAGAASSHAHHALAATQYPARVMSSPFAHWGDTGRYFGLDNNGFENGSTSWTLAGGAKVVSGNESFHVNAAGDSTTVGTSALADLRKPA
jgi:hypothetical protein